MIVLVTAAVSLSSVQYVGDIKSNNIQKYGISTPSIPALFLDGVTHTFLLIFSLQVPQKEHW